MHHDLNSMKCLSLIGLFCRDLLRLLFRSNCGDDDIARFRSNVTASSDNAVRSKSTQLLTRFVATGAHQRAGKGL